MSSSLCLTVWRDQDEGSSVNQNNHWKTINKEDWRYRAQEEEQRDEEEDSITRKGAGDAEVSQQDNS